MSDPGARRTEPFDVAVVGAGVVGTAIARELAQRGAHVLIVEGGPDIGAGTSKANTAILHTGFDAKPDTTEARLVARGATLLGAYAERRGIAVERTGALLVAWTEEQLDTLPRLAEQAAQNGYRHTHLVDRGSLTTLEPHLGAGALGALAVPDEAIIDPWSPVIAFATDAVLAGAQLVRGAPLHAIDLAGAHHTLHTRDESFTARWIVNAAGLHADDVDRLAGFSAFTVTARRGELIVFDKLARRLVHHILLPVPTATTKGVLVSPTVFGNVVLGPTAEDLDDKDDRSTSRAGLDGLLAHGRRIVPALVDEEITATYAGLRAATEQSDYRLATYAEQRWITAGGIRSTGLTASMAIAEHVARELVGAGLALRPRDGDGNGDGDGAWSVPPLGETTRRPHGDAARIEADPAYGEIVCHCERVTAGELRDAWASPIPPVDLDGLRRRTRVLMGRCQGFHCAAAARTPPEPPMRRSPASGAGERRIGGASGAGRVDVLVVGAGPAGLSAAARLAAAGVAVLVVERAEAPGGIPRHTHHQGFGWRDLRRSLTGPQYAARLADRAVAAGAAIELATTADIASDAWAGTRAFELTAPGGRRRVEAGAVLLATGCRERPRNARLVPGDRPDGVLTTGALQVLIDAGRFHGARAVVVGAEHVSYSAALTLRHAGCAVAAMVTTEPGPQSFAAFDVIRRVVWRTPLLTRRAPARINGRHGRVEAVVLDDGRVIECDTVVFSGDWIPDHELARRGGIGIDAPTRGPSVDIALRTRTPGVFAAGNLLHAAATADVCALDGRHVAAAITAWLGDGRWPEAPVAITAEAPFAWVSPNRLSPGGSTLRSPNGRLLALPGAGRGPGGAGAGPGHPGRATRVVTVAQHGRVLWHGRRRLVANRLVSIPDGWLAAVDPDLGAVRVSAS